MTLVDSALPPLAEDRLLSWKRVKDLTGLSRTTCWRLQKAGDFPQPVVISPGRIGWRESDVAAWKASRSPRGSAPPTRPPQPRSFGRPSEDVPPQPAPEPLAAIEPLRSQGPASPPATPAKRRRGRPAGPEQMRLDF